MIMKEKQCKYIGVCRYRHGEGFYAKIFHNNKTNLLGYFNNELDGALAYDNYVIQNNLNRRLNFPDPEPENLIPNTRLIRVSGGYFAVVDEEDFERVNQYTWTLLWKKGGENYYAHTFYFENGEKFHLIMHRFILGVTELNIDHINGNGLHNYKSNLRQCTQKQNSWNRRSSRFSVSKYRGVYKRKNGNFSATITCNKIKHYLGVFKTEIDAGKAFDLKAREFYGQYAYQNFPDNA
jgi:hypothetical protein